MSGSFAIVCNGDPIDIRPDFQDYLACSKVIAGILGNAERGTFSLAFDRKIVSYFVCVSNKQPLESVSFLTGEDTVANIGVIREIIRLLDFLDVEEWVYGVFDKKIVAFLQENCRWSHETHRILSVFTWIDTRPVHFTETHAFCKKRMCAANHCTSCVLFTHKDDMMKLHPETLVELLAVHAFERLYQSDERNEVFYRKEFPVDIDLTVIAQQHPTINAFLPHTWIFSPPECTINIDMDVHEFYDDDLPIDRIMYFEASDNYEVFFRGKVVMKCDDDHYSREYSIELTQRIDHIEWPEPPVIVTMFVLQGTFLVCHY